MFSFIQLPAPNLYGFFFANQMKNSHKLDLGPSPVVPSRLHLYIIIQLKNYAFFLDDFKLSSVTSLTQGNQGCGTRSYVNRIVNFLSEVNSN